MVRFSLSKISPTPATNMGFVYYMTVKLAKDVSFVEFVAQIFARNPKIPLNIQTVLASFGTLKLSYYEPV